MLLRSIVDVLIGHCAAFQLQLAAVHNVSFVVEWKVEHINGRKGSPSRFTMLMMQDHLTHQGKPYAGAMGRLAQYALRDGAPLNHARGC